MRYSINENTVLLGKLEPNQSVTIKVLDIETDRLVQLSTDICQESQYVPGLYLWNTKNINDTTITGFKNLYYVMTDGTNDFDGKFIFGGYVDRDISAELKENGFNPEEILHILRIINGRI